MPLSPLPGKYPRLYATSANGGSSSSAGGSGACEAQTTWTRSRGTEAGNAVADLLFGEVLPDDENQFYFRVQGEELVWAMPAYLRTNVFKSVEDMQVQ